MPKIFIMNKSGNTQFYDVNGDTIYVGRSEDNDIQIKDRFVSRLHLKINRSGNRYFIKDLKSTNGTFVDGKQVISGVGFEVDEGVPIVIGMNVICIGEQLSSDEQIFVRSMQEHRELIEDVYTLNHDRPYTFRNNMALINKISDILMESMPMDELMEKVLDHILDFFHRIDKSAIILLDEETNEVFKYYIQSQDEMDDLDLGYSWDVVDRVIQDGNPVIIVDTDTEDEYSLSDTLKMLKIGSVMCVPLISGTQMRGVLYVDSVNSAYGFRKEDLSLFTHLSAVIATTVESRLWGDDMQQYNFDSGVHVTFK